MRRKEHVMSLIKNASLLCNGDECFCSYDCGIEKPWALSKFGEDKHCPLEKYGMPKGRKIKPTDPVQAIKNAPTYDEILNASYELCKACEHAHARDDFDEFCKHCSDCPVYRVEENINEALAEAACS